MSEFFAERKNSLPPTSRRYPVFIENISSAFVKWTRKDVNANALDLPPPTASPKTDDAEAFEKVIFRPIGVAEDTDSANLLPFDCTSAVHEPLGKSADSAERKYELPLSGKDNDIRENIKSQEKPSIRRPYERSFSLRMGFANRTGEETLVGVQDLDIDLDLDPGKNSWRRSESSSIPNSGRKERPEMLGNWRDRSKEHLNSTGTTSFDGMRCSKTWQKSRRLSDNQEKKSNWREGRVTEQDNWRKSRNKEEAEEPSNWRKPKRCESKPEIGTEMRLRPEAETE